MAEMAGPKPRKKSKPRETAAKPAAKSRAHTAAKPREHQEPAIETSPKTTYQATASDGEQVSITPPAQTKKNGSAWLLSFLLLLVIVGAGHLTWPRWQPYVMAYVPDGLKVAFADPRVNGLTTRIGELESKTDSLRQRDEVIARLDGERKKLQESLAGVLKRIESLEHSIVDVKEMAKAAATVEEAAAASLGLRELYERLEKLENVPVQSADPAFASRLDKLEDSQALTQEFSQRIIELEQSGASARRGFTETLNQLNASRQTVQALEGRLASVEARPASDRADTSSVVILAVSELRDAVYQGRAYLIELEAVKAAAGDKPAILEALMSLNKHAAKGIGTISDLREAFSTLASTIVAAGRGAPDAGWMDRTLVRISSLVKFRRIDGLSETNSTEFLVSRAEKHLGSGDVAAAIRAVEQLDDMAKAAASEWLSNAKARLSAEQSLASLRANTMVMRPAVKG